MTPTNEFQDIDLEATLKEYKIVRETGCANMFDRRSVYEIACQMDLLHLMGVSQDKYMYKKFLSKLINDDKMINK